MNGLALLRLAIQNVVRNPTRSILTMLGVMIGVAAVIIMVAIGQGAQGAIEERIKNLGTNMIVITPGVATTAGVSGGAQSMPSLTIEDADLLRKDAQSLVAVSPVVMTRTTVVGGQANWRAAIYGVDPSYTEIRDWQVASGRFFDEVDIKGRKKVCVLGATVASRVFGEDDPVGQLVRLRDVPIEVIGVLKAKGQTAEGADQDDVVLAPYTTVQTRLAGRQFIGQILGSASSADQLDLAQSEVKLILRERHGLSVERKVRANAAYGQQHREHSEDLVAALAPRRGDPGLLLGARPRGGARVGGRLFSRNLIQAVRAVSPIPEEIFTDLALTERASGHSASSTSLPSSRRAC